MEEKKCLKCGRDCPEDQVFCGECLAEMARYPVKPGVVVLLPQKERSRPAPRRRHTAPAPEEQIARLKKRITALWLALILTLSVMGALSVLTISGYFSDEEAKLLPGQNYSSETTTPDANQ